MPLVTAYRVDTGQTVTIPHHWLGHPVLGANFTDAPPTQDAESAPDDHIQYEFDSNPEEGEPNAIYPV